MATNTRNTLTSVQPRCKLCTTLLHRGVAPGPGRQARLTRFVEDVDRLPVIQHPTVTHRGDTGEPADSAQSTDPAAVARRGLPARVPLLLRWSLAGGLRRDVRRPQPVDG